VVSVVVVVAPVAVGALVVVVMTLRHVVMFMDALVVVVPALSDMVVFVHADVVVMTARRHVPVTVVARVRVMTTGSDMVMNVGARPGVVVALVRVPMHDRARRMRVVNMSRRPHATNAGYPVDARHPRNAWNLGCDVSRHRASSRWCAGDPGESPTQPRASTAVPRPYPRAGRKL
jgi:hypothetical protein